MQTLRERAAALAVVAFATAFVAAPAGAQAPYPNRNLRIIAPVQPGGGVDLVARTVADRLGRALGQSVVVENQSGGGGVVGSLATARAAPDGYTLMVGYVGTHGTNPAVRKLPYDAVRDFTPVAMVGGTPNVLIVPTAMPVATLPEFVAYAKAQAGKLSYGSAGPGTLTHLAMEQFKVAAGFEATHVAYRGIGPAIADILGGQTQALFPGLAAGLPHIKGGKVKPLAVTGRTRHRLLPDVPTFEELGYRGFDGVQWYGIVGPANLPAPIVKRLNDEINRMLEAPDLRERLAGEALEPMPMTPDQFGQYIRDDIARWSKLAKDRGIELTD
ncbi:MAG: tripartite tricarboxylate transporter substrate binding protein [Betaproteobacteria bacterium]|nr:tripartite tricarboxylate transporter substrate binding protein [Betaproteobacteria bacterium]MDH5285023.1 tripartite tricarboxylate transporter substrate binding protein [Betaproteobacteria bacterium]